MHHWSEIVWNWARIFVILSRQFVVGNNCHCESSRSNTYIYTHITMGAMTLMCETYSELLCCKQLMLLPESIPVSISVLVLENNFWSGYPNWKSRTMNHLIMWMVPSRHARGQWISLVSFACKKYATMTLGFSSLIAGDLRWTWYRPDRNVPWRLRSAAGANKCVLQRSQWWSIRAACGAHGSRARNHGQCPIGTLWSDLQAR